MKMKKVLSMFLAMTMTTGLLGTQMSIANAKPDPYDRGYYGSQLTDNVSIAFYDAMHHMNFASGEQYVMNYNGMEAGAAAYASGDTLLMRQFGAAVDSFRYDNPGYFYVDWDNLTLNITRDSNGKYQVAIGQGRTDSYLIKNNNIGKQIIDYGDALNELVKGVNGGTTKEKAKIINDRICKMVSYGFGNRANGLPNPGAEYIGTAYGALINHLATSEGYSMLYKDALNKLGINCELVNGYFIDGDTTEPRMWTYVQDDDGKWYATDVTMNDSNASTNPNYDKYFWKSTETFKVDHIESGYISSDRYDMPYPTLNKAWATDTSSGLLDYSVTSHGGVTHVLEVTYDGLDASTLVDEQGLYMAYRTQTTSNGSNVWSAWQSVLSNSKVEEDAGKVYIKEFGSANTSVGTIEIGVFNVPADGNKQYTKNAEKYNLVEKFSITNPWANGDYIEPATVTSTKPAKLLQDVQNITATQKITVTFDKPLKLTDGTKPKISWTTSALNKTKITDADVKQTAYLDESSITFDGTSTISFNFTPSTEFVHNFTRYTFTIDNMVNVISKKEDGVKPESFTVTYAYDDASVCSKYYNDGRIYVDAMANTAIVSNNDLSTHLWKFEDGTYVAPNQWDKIALVVTEPTDKNALINATNNTVSDASGIKAITAFDIELNVCGQRLQDLPNGSRVRICLDYPGNTTDNTQNVVYKLYHFERKNSRYISLEEIDCVPTPYGLETTIGYSIGTCSPYVLVALDANKVKSEDATARGLSLDFNGKGGAVSLSTSNRINAVKSGDFVKYVLTPNAGYEIEYATLNGLPVEINDNTVVVNYSDLVDSKNVFSVGFVATTTKANENDRSVENLTESFANSIAMKPVTPVTDHKHTMQHIIAADDLCTGKLNGEYWHCDTCGKNFKDSRGAELLTSLVSHKLTTIARVAPTHTSEGVEQHRKCSVCNRLYDMSGNIVTLVDLRIERGTHSFDTIDKDASGHWYVCSCGETTKAKKEQHSFDWTTITPQTSTTTGTERGTCTICGYVKDAVIPKGTPHPHEIHHLGRVDADCVHNGSLEVWYCDVCTKYYEDAAGTIQILDPKTPVNPENHYKYGEISIINEKDPTYDSNGYTGDVVCSHCNKIFEKGEVIPKLERPHTHTIVFVMGNPATCQSQGSKSHYICTSCDRIFNDKDGYDEITLSTGLVLAKNASVHAKDRVIINNRREATCNTQGYAGDVYCGDCGAFMYKGTQIERTNRHTPSATIQHNATSHYYVCKDCGEIIESTVQAHAGGRATCVSKAVCAECGVEYGTLDNTKHNHFAVRKIVAPTSANEGYTGDIYCTDCNQDVDKGSTVPKIDHEHNFIVHTAKAPTCHRDGNIAYWECKVCSKLFTDEYGLHEVTASDVVISQEMHESSYVTKITENGHEEVCENCEEIKVKSFTPHEGGKATCVKKAVCTICGHEYGQLDNTVHENTYVKDHINATPSKDGYTGDTYCKDCENLVSHGYTISSIGHVHPVREVPEFVATCERQGNIKHWVCDICGEFFLDEEGKIKVTEADVITAKLAHTPTGAFEGNANGHWQICSVCGKDTDRVDHITERINAKAPTTTEEGYSGDLVCKVCGYTVEKGTKLNKLTNTSSTNPSDNVTTTPSGSNTPSENTKPDENTSSTNTNPSNGNTTTSSSGSNGITSVTNEQFVWIVDTGECYHSSKICSNMKEPYQVTLSMAKSMGKRACSKCYISTNSSSQNTIIINSGSGNTNNTNNNSNNSGLNITTNNGNNNSNNGNYNSNNGVRTGDDYTTLAIVFTTAALGACLAFIVFKKKK